MLTAMRAVDNLLTGADHDIWAVNAESVYHETDVADEHPYRSAPETPRCALAASGTESAAPSSRLCRGRPPASSGSRCRPSGGRR